jgi:alkanesulfonate monooxygenase SsuD/methylene tetrahydromethanopterin reductase-like flavin-dependent oxidoreductase (luciferase family)
VSDEQVSNVVQRRSAVAAWSNRLPGVPKWTKKSIVQHLSIGALGANTVRTPSQVADKLERWTAEAEVDGFNNSIRHQAWNIFVDVVKLLLPELR